MKSSSTPFSWQVQDLVRSADDPDVPHVVLGGSADAPPLAMEETKMSHASRFCGRRSIWRGFAESSWSRSVLDVSYKKQCIIRVIISWQPHYLVVMHAGLCCPVQCICILDVSCVATVMRIKSWLYTVYSIILNTACDMDTVVRVSIVLCSTGWYFVEGRSTLSHFVIWNGSLLYCDAL